MTPEDPMVQRYEHRCIHQSIFDQICASLNNGQEEGIGRSATGASEYPLDIGAIGGGLSREAAGVKETS